jgi:beta-glucuronidase
MKNEKVGNKAIELSLWKFQIDQQDFGETDGWMSETHSHDGWLDVSSYQAWDTYEFALRNYEGVGWYYTEFPVIDTQKHYHTLEFDGVGGVSKVWANGELCAENDSRYLPFTADIQKYLKPDSINCVAVKVDNRFRGKAFLPGAERIEWVQYGGLTHHVRVTLSPMRSIADLKLRAEADGKLTGTVTVTNHTQDDLNGELAIAVENARFVTECVCPGNNSVKIPFELLVHDIESWSPASPCLYSCQVELSDGNTTHIVTDKIGFRTIEVRGTEIFLNGKPIFLKGANRYDEYDPYGCCPPPELIREDFMNMKRCGMNLIRTHYPQDEIHYRIADEIGIMYMIEVPINWWFPTDEETFED